MGKTKMFVIRILKYDQNWVICCLHIRNVNGKGENFKQNLCLISSSVKAV